MKKRLLVILGYMCLIQGFLIKMQAMEQKNEAAQLTDREEGMRAYRNFHAKAAAYTLDPIEVRTQLPLLFMYIPAELNSAITRYIPYRFPDTQKVVAELGRIMDSLVSRRMFVWHALAYEFGLVPYYNFDQRYFYFEQPDEPVVPSVLKGKRKDYRLEHFKRLHDDIKRREKNGKLDELTRQAQAKYQEMQQALPKEYKIHLMPKEDPTIVIVKLLQALKNDPELQSLIAAFKVMAVATVPQKNSVYPIIVIYPASGKANAQKALNKLYALFKNEPGSGVQPRYNAKVTDLIWIAQGDSHVKSKEEYQSYFEQPNRVYYRKDFTGKDENYHLIHPETDKEIV